MTVQELERIAGEMGVELKPKAEPTQNKTSNALNALEQEDKDG